MNKSQTDVLAIDIGGSSIKSALVTTSAGGMNLIHKKRHEFKTSHVDELVAILRNLVQEYGCTSVGISTLGLIGHDGVVISARNIEGYDNHDWAKVFPKAQVQVGNDGQCAALGVYHADKARGVGTTLVHIVVGSGIGSGIVINGKLYRGPQGFSGNFGRSRIGTLAKSFQVQEVASAWGIEAQVEQVLGTRMSFRDISQQLSNPQIANIIESSGACLGMAMANVMHMINPDVMTLGGGVVEALGSAPQNIYFNAAKKMVAEISSVPMYNHTKFAITALGNDAALYGAAKLFQ